MLPSQRVAAGVLALAVLCAATTTATAAEFEYLLALDRAPATAAAPATTVRVQLLERRRTDAGLPLHRDQRLATTQIVIVAMDFAEREIARTVVADPRLLRAEFPDAGGALHGQVLVRPAAPLRFSLPDDARIHLLRLFEPRWDGSRFSLRPIADLVVGPGTG